MTPTPNKPLTDIERRMLALLDYSSPKRPGWLGSCLWPTRHRMPQHFARPAGRVLKGLEKRGLVRWISRMDNRYAFGWIKLRSR